MALLAGATIELDGQEWTAPPLNFLQLQRLDPHIKTVTSGQFSTEWLASAVKIIHASLSRNYPELSEDDMAEMLNMGNFNRALDAVLSTSGMVPAKGVVAGQG